MFQRDCQRNLHLLNRRIGQTGTGTATASYEEQGKLILDGNGNITGTTNTDVAGVLATLPVTGTIRFSPTVRVRPP